MTATYSVFISVFFHRCPLFFFCPPDVANFSGSLGSEERREEEMGAQDVARYGGGEETGDGKRSQEEALSTFAPSFAQASAGYLRKGRFPPLSFSLLLSSTSQTGD